MLNMKVYADIPHSDNSSPQNYLLEWKNLSYSLTKNENTQTILKSVSGYAQSGQILAVMGPSGSGKTTLLSLLSNRLFSYRGVKTEGEVTLNKVSIKDFKSTHFIKYVLQEDNLFVTQTPRESLTFNCKLKLPHLSEERVIEKVNEALEYLRLQKVADMLIGSATIKGLSGGEKKRVSIGNELISNPCVLILDEPTSGLDSWNALHLIEILKHQAEMGMMIIFTIHQPNSQIFKLFDRLILVSEGSFLYQGPTAELVSHFTRINYKCPEHINPPEYFMRLFHVNDRFHLSAEENEILESSKKFYKETAAFMLLPDDSELDDILSHKVIGRPPRLTQFKTLVVRSFRNVIRQKILSVIKIVQAAFISSLVILIYHNNSNDEVSVQNLTGVLFFLTVVMITPAMQGQVLTFPLEKAAFLTEYREDLYSSIWYYCSKFCCEIPFQIVFIVILSLVVYFVIPLNTDSADKYFIFVGICFTAQIAGNAMGYMIGSMVPNIAVGILAGPFLMTIFIAYAGFISSTDSFPEAFSWIQYLSSYRYCFKALMLNQFTDFTLQNAEQRDPIQIFSISGEIWELVGAQLLLIFGMSAIAILSLKISGQYHKTH